MNKREYTWDVALLILNYNSYQLTIDLVDDLLTQVTDLRILYLIVDNNSQNQSYDELSNRFKNNSNVIVVQSGNNGGYAKGNNYGLRLLEKYIIEYVVIINNDVKFNINILKKCINVDKSVPDAGMISPVQYLPTGEIAPTRSLKIHSFKDDVKQYLGSEIILPKIKYKSNCEYPNLMRVGIIPGSFIFTKFSKIREVNYFDEDTFLFCEEHFISRKYIEHGWHNYIIIDDSYIHEHSKTIKSVHSIKKQFKLLLDSQKKYANKYYRCPKIQVPILTVLNTLYANLLCLVKKIRS